MTTIAVLGETHNAWVTAGCLAHLGHDVTILSSVECRYLTSEPRLAELLAEAFNNNRFRRVSPLDIKTQFEVGWVAHDTPLDEQGAPIADVLYHMLSIARVKANHVVLSSQVPVGFCQRLDMPIVYVPENMRIGDGVRTFMQPDRLVIGATTRMLAVGVLDLLGAGPVGPSRMNIVEPKTMPILTDLATAEMIKHATNAYLATCVSLANELEEIGAFYDVDMDQVTAALRSDSRIGPKAYVEAGRPFTGGTLKRDLRALQQTAKIQNIKTPLVDAVLAVNDRMEKSE